MGSAMWIDGYPQSTTRIEQRVVGDIPNHRIITIITQTVNRSGIGKGTPIALFFYSVNACPS